MEVSTMFYNYRYCVFTWDGRWSQVKEAEGVVPSRLKSEEGSLLKNSEEEEK